ncbi:galactose mutarotase-like enzyme [Rhodoligotrophos appendicifer]|uniref:aldose 1-epimerase family protein n=1 Tax=Rhodoligotrophos appendicifer TaxID=987056 RepID=UPI00117E93D7|nr:aldose 1-epimerase family protein [Rhodoligotrophos appendicifer]
MSETHIIRGSGITATIKSLGAELISLRKGGDEELLWQAGPEWPRHSPVLFPIVGRLADDTLHHGGRTYSMSQHGFARDSRFEWTDRSATRASLRLCDNQATQAQYPFPFCLDVTHDVSDARLTVTMQVTNPGDEALPFSIGAHPAFRWPLVAGIAKEAHRLTFAKREPGPARSVDGGLIGPPKPLPFDGLTLPLSPELFRDDAIVLPTVQSRSARFSALDPAGATVREVQVSWRGFVDLGIWSKPTGAPFLCIEPWHGTASPVGWDGPFLQKPGLVHLPPGQSTEFSWWVEI